MLSSTVGSTFNTLANNRSVTSGAGDGSGTAVLNLTEADALSLLSTQNSESFALNLDPGVTFIINIAGTNFSGDDAIKLQLFANDATEASSTILNFYEATNIDFQSNMNGVVLAPYAHIDSPQGGWNGVAVAESFYLSDELRPINDGGFTGTIPPPPVPLPASVWILMAGIGSLGAMRKLQKANA